jgi:predicted dehydrogenase
MSRPRLGFLGVGWIGRHRMEALAESGLIEAAAICDPVEANALEAARLAPDARRVASFEELVDLDLDGIVVATPSALHAEQSIRALDRGLSVFCQKPLGRNAAEAAAVVEAARRADRLLGLDLSYRHTAVMEAIRPLARSGELGRIHAVDLVFHNAYGPDKPWFFDPRLSGGGCVMDLGVHLVDLALWTLDFPAVAAVESHLFAKGRRLSGRSEVEDFALATLTLSDGAVVRLACSWNLHAGRDAVISAAFHGSEGGAAFENVGGSFFDFVAERYRGTGRTRLVDPPDPWGGRAAVAWARQLHEGAGFDPSAERFVDVARVLDSIYA